MCCYLCATQRKAKASGQILISIWCMHMGGQFTKPFEINKFYSLFILFDLITISCNKAGAMKSCSACSHFGKMALPLVCEGVRTEQDKVKHQVESTRLESHQCLGKNICSDMYKNVTDYSNPMASSLIKRASGLSSRSAEENKQLG